MESENCEDDYEVLIAGKTEQSVRERHPSSYTLQIDSFSFLVEMLGNCNLECYDSETFEASGFKWKLHLYPNGDKERNGEGHISMYIAIESTNEMPPGWEIHAECKFFVLDQIREKYLVLQDAVRVRRFHEARKEWGLARVLSRHDFEDVAKGYLLQDKCVFGVEIFVCNYSGKGECLARPVMLKSHSTTYTWEVADYSILPNCVCSSPVFTLGDYEWKINLYPRGKSCEEGRSVSAFLCLEGVSALTAEVYAEFKLSIKDQKNSKHEVHQADHLFLPNTDWGWHAFVSLNDIRDPSKGFVVNGTLIIEAEITRLSTVKKFFVV